ncbi:MAG: hypothetical protein MRZ59_08275 [Clostridiales bacterium]|nr:hypothetical protein [Clostridiales bacterium]MDY3747861.1 hypothetical protein [Lachnospiraceae bacterium]
MLNALNGGKFKEGMPGGEIAIEKAKKKRRVEFEDFALGYDIELIYVKRGE